MGVLDKIKNALFEVEYVEVDEPPKKEKKSRVKEKEKKEDKPIAKKIVLPGKKEEKIEELHEEELRDEDFEIRPKNEVVKEKPRDEFKFMDDKDFKMDEEVLDEPEIVHVLDAEDEKKKIEDTLVDSPVEEAPTVVEETQKDKSLDDYYSRSSSPNYFRESRPYGVDNSYSVPVHEYGTYEKKEEKTYFKPSPIISPIYGILDKNYKKEDVHEKRDVRITSSYTRSNISVDDIRNKAYGRKVENEPVVEDTKIEEEVEEEEDNLLVDLSDRAKPEVKELTMGDALEYFQDLGLEYNVDYVDVSKEKSVPKRVEPSTEVEELKTVEQPKEEEAPRHGEIVEEPRINQEVETLPEDNDNLFDLIDSMYQDKD